MDKIQILFVCMANICRSPMAQGIARDYLQSEGLTGYFEVASAGVHVPRSGQLPDPRAIQIAEGNGVDLSGIKSRAFRDRFFSEFNYILTMDEGNFRELSERCPPEFRYKIQPMAAFLTEHDNQDIPDPYFSNLSGFQRVFDLLKLSIEHFFEQKRLERNL